MSERTEHKQHWFYRPATFLGLLAAGSVLTISSQYVADVITDDPPSTQEVEALKIAAEARHISDDELKIDHQAYEDALRAAARPGQVENALEGIGMLAIGTGIFSVTFSSPQRREDYGITSTPVAE